MLYPMYEIHFLADLKSSRQREFILVKILISTKVQLCGIYVLL